MMKEAIRALETGVLAEIGLIAFLVAFVLILVRVFTMSKASREEARHLPLDEPEEFVFPTNNHHAKHSTPH